MPNVIFKDVTLAFTQNLTKASDFGGYNYSFIINKKVFCDAIRNALEQQKKKCWDDSKNTDSFIVNKTHAKTKDDVAYAPVAEMMTLDDLLVQVKSKETPIENTKKVPLARGTTADILIDAFEFDYNKRQFICIKAHADRGITIKVRNLKEFTSNTQYFAAEVDDSQEGINMEAVEDVMEAPF